jgi:predicted membrane protein
MDKDYRREHRHDWATDRRRQMNGRRGWGVILILAGLVLLANIFEVFDYDVRRIVFSWQMLLIAIGVISLVNNRSWAPGIILIAIGGFSLANHYLEIPDYWHQAFWPLLVLVVGVYLLVAPPRYMRSGKRAVIDGDNRDFIDEVAVFSGGDRIITSQNFKGGRITSIFGGSKINLMNSKLAEGPQVLDTMSVFGGSTIIVPADWTVRVEVVAIFGGFSDRRERMPNIVYDQNTMLVIKGMAIFGGGEVKTFGVR